MPLLVAATPIGNLDDASPRLRQALAEASLILAEDTRTLRKLASALGVEIKARVLSAHGFNEGGRIAILTRELEAGATILLTTDAGTPGLSDPGYLLVEAAHAAGASVRVLAGPSAVAAAVSVSGFPGIPMHVFGFPPRKARELEAFLRVALALPGTLVFHESPHRTLRLVAQLAQLAPERQACLCRELTKLHEEVQRASLAALASHLAEREALRGEVTLVVGPGEAAPRRAGLPEVDSLPRLAGHLARAWGVARNPVYQGITRLHRQLTGAGEEE